MDFGLNYGWVCPVCGKVNAPWASQCTCNGKISVPCGPTCNTGTPTPSVSPILANSVTPEEFQKAVEDYLNINSTYAPWTIDSSGKIHKVDDGPSDSTANN